MSESGAEVEEDGVFVIAPRMGLPESPCDLMARMEALKEQLIPRAETKAKELMDEQAREKDLDVADMGSAKRRAAINKMVKKSGVLQARLVFLDLMHEDEDLPVKLMKEMLITFYEAEDSQRLAVAGAVKVKAQQAAVEAGRKRKAGAAGARQAARGKRDSGQK